MLRRFSTFGKSRKEKDSSKVNGLTNGTSNGTSNGLSNGTSGGAKPLTNGTATHAVNHHKEAEHAAHSASVQGLLEEFAQLVHASRRPLPTQSGDGAYLDHEVPSGLFQDLKSLGFKDVKTLMEVMRQPAGGLHDDKTYLMERVIQACLSIL